MSAATVSIPKLLSHPHPLILLHLYLTFPHLGETRLKVADNQAEKQHLEVAVLIEDYSISSKGVDRPAVACCMRRSNL